MKFNLPRCLIVFISQYDSIHSEQFKREKSKPSSVYDTIITAVHQKQTLQETKILRMEVKKI